MDDSVVNAVLVFSLSSASARNCFEPSSMATSTTSVRYRTLERFKSTMQSKYIRHEVLHRMMLKITLGDGSLRRQLVRVPDDDGVSGKNDDQYPNTTLRSTF